MKMMQCVRAVVEAEDDNEVRRWSGRVLCHSLITKGTRAMN